MNSNIESNGSDQLEILNLEKHVSINKKFFFIKSFKQ